MSEHYMKSCDYEGCTTTEEDTSTKPLFKAGWTKVEMTKAQDRVMVADLCPAHTSLVKGMLTNKATR